MRSAEQKERIVIRAIKGILTLILFLFCLSVWPGYLIHDYDLSRTISEGALFTEVLKDSDIIIQYFSPQKVLLSDIEFAIDYEEQNKGEILLFTLCNEEGKELFSCSIPMEEIEAGSYYSVPVRQRLKVGEIYYWSLSAPEGWRGGCRLMYTPIVANQALENLHMEVSGQLYDPETYQSVSQYNYIVHKDKAVIAGTYWTGAIVLYLIMMELIDRLFQYIYKKRSAEVI